jgi:hypothetical protein
VQRTLLRHFTVNTIRWFVLIGVLALEAGCVVGRRTIDLPIAAPATAPPQARGHIYIAAVTDARAFQNKPDDPSTPSIDGDVGTLTAADKDHMIGRQRNGFGHAMGDIALPTGDSVTQRTRALLAQGLARAGYLISTSPGAPNTATVAINEFWAWSTPGFATISFEAKINCTLTIDDGDGNQHTLTVKGYGLNHGQFAKNVNWQEAYTPAFDDFETNLGSELQKLALKNDP